MRGHGAALLPSVFAANNGIPASLSPNYTGGATSSNAMLLPQGLLACSNCGNPNFPYNVQYQPGYYSPQVYSCYHQNLVASQMASSSLQTSSFSTQRHYQASFHLNKSDCGDHNLESKNKEHQEVKKCDINLDTIFQIADEVMQTRPNSLIRVVTPDKPGPLSVPLSGNNPAGATKASHVSYGPIITSVIGSGDLFALSVNSQPEQMLKDAILEASIEDVKD
ncbi:uncharacterized protein AB9W97_009148 [Spinachia spinachia]